MHQAEGNYTSHSCRVPSTASPDARAATILRHIYRTVGSVVGPLGGSRRCLRLFAHHHSTGGGCIEARHQTSSLEVTLFDFPHLLPLPPYPMRGSHNQGKSYLWEAAHAPTQHECAFSVLSTTTTCAEEESELA